jgi:uncharacterized phiE125 gp8 family phage protein
MAIDWTYWPSDPAFSQQGSYDWRHPWTHSPRNTSIRWVVKQTVAPTVEPMTVTGAKVHLRVDTADEDDLIANLIQAAREYVETRTGLALLPQTFVLQLDRFPFMDRIETWPAPASPLGAILIPKRPVASVTSIVWTDQNGSPTTVNSSTYQVDLNSKYARIVPNVNSFWPNQSSPGLAPMAGVQVTFVSGFNLPTLIPANLMTAMRLMVGHWYINREEVAVDNRLVAIQLPAAAEQLIGLHCPALVG